MNRASFLAATSGLMGQTILHQFTTAPFPHASRKNGHDYENKHYDLATHYRDSSVGIFIPPGFRDRGGELDFIVHFHGWNNDVQHVFERYQLREQVEQSRRNAILLVPQGPKDAPDSGDGKLELDQDGFKLFVGEVARWLYSSGITSAGRAGQIVLTAHSGGYGGAGGVLTRGGVNESITDVLLFDAAYGYYDAFSDWVKGAPVRHLLSLFTDDTSTGNTMLMSLVQGQQPNLFVRLADTATLPELQTKAPTFLLTETVEHDELLQKHDWYALYLQTTALGVIN
jgi:hypothetical protein